VRPTSYSFHTVALTDGVVTGIQDVTEADIWINGGFFVFRNDVFDYIHDGEDLVAEPVVRLIEDKLLIAHRYEGFWAPMDTLKDKHNLEALLESGWAPWEVWESPRRRRRKVPF
jgi:glucose-1-phosphate cytidylyltransferase